MDCRTAQQLITDAVADDLSDQRRDALVAHCDGCASCRAEWEDLRRIWDRMGRSRIPAPASDLAERFGRRLSQSSAAHPYPWRGAVAAALALLLIGGIGGFAAGRRLTETPTLADAASPAYLFLLYGDTEAPGLNDTQLIAEYARWAGELRADGKLIEADRLLDQVVTVAQGEAGPMSTTDLDAVSGFFLVRADDLDSALQMALEGPHARYGGRIDVRPIAY